MVRSLANRDAAGLRELFDDPVEFRALTPGKLWEASSPAAVTEIILGTWFGPDTDIIRVSSLETTHVAHRARVDYRLRLLRPEGPAVVAQTAYYSSTRGRITSMHLLCSGIRQVEELGTSPEPQPGTVGPPVGGAAHG